MTDHVTSHDPAAPHAGHDLLLVAAHAAGDTTGVEAARAREQIAGCDGCRDLAVDLATLRTVSRQLPPPQRSRDFRLSPETAARLRSRSPWQRLLDGITSPRGFGRPLAATLMTLGLAGLMVSATPLGAPLGGSSASRDSAERAVVPSVGGTGFGADAAPEAGAPSGSPRAPTTQDTSTGVVDTTKGAQGAPGASGSPGVPPAAIAPAPSGAAPSDVAPSSPTGRAASPGPVNLTPGAGPVFSTDGSGASAGPGALAANGGADAPREATTPAAWAGPSPLALLSAAFLVVGLAILAVRRRASSRLA